MKHDKLIADYDPLPEALEHVGDAGNDVNEVNILYYNSKIVNWIYKQSDSTNPGQCGKLQSFNHSVEKWQIYCYP